MAGFGVGSDERVVVEDGRGGFDEESMELEEIGEGFGPSEERWEVAGQ